MIHYCFSRECNELGKHEVSPFEIRSISLSLCFVSFLLFSTSSLSLNLSTRLPTRAKSPIEKRGFFFFLLRVFIATQDERLSGLSRSGISCLPNQRNVKRTQSLVGAIFKSRFSTFLFNFNGYRITFNINKFYIKIHIHPLCPCS